MRVRSLLTFTTGAAAGAGAIYWLDPDHGPDRRAQARRDALRRGGRGAQRTARDLGRRGQGVLLAAVAGYSAGRAEAARDSADDPAPSSPPR